jgi:primary-amine oxidase
MPLVRRRGVWNTVPGLRSAVGALLVLAALCGLPGGAAAGPCIAEGARHRFTADETFTYTHPSGPQQTRWVVKACVDDTYGLVIGTSTFHPYPDRPVQVFHDARVSEIFVVYHDGLRFLDVGTFSNGLMILKGTDCPESLGARVRADGRVCQEVRDRGLAWKTDSGSRRGRELVLWGVLRASNYKYVVEWVFRDDGTVLGRVGPTGHNLPHHHEVTHSHTVYWRLDVDLAGPGGDSARVQSHDERFRQSGQPGQVASDDLTLVRTERGIDWLGRQFTMLKIQDATLRNQNAVPKAGGYLLMGQRAGTARHQEPFTHHDLWVTRAPADKTGAELAAQDLPAYVADKESVDGEDIVVWYSTTLHHVERDEDDHGPTQIVWVGFLMLPFDLFDRSPLAEPK